MTSEGGTNRIFTQERTPYIVEDPSRILVSVTPKAQASIKFALVEELLQQYRETTGRGVLADYRIAVITATSLEAGAILAASGQSEFDAEGQFGSGTGDRNYYRFIALPAGGLTAAGQVPHQIVVAQPIALGPAPATRAASDLVRTFPNVRDVIIVGIGGGIPLPETPYYDVYLGDIVVGRDGIIQHDYVQIRSGKHDWRDGLSTPSDTMLNGINALERKRVSGNNEWHQCFAEVSNDPRWQRPPENQDVLYFNNTVVTRVPHASRQQGHPRVHVGRIGSGSTLLMDADVRDWLHQELAVRTIEMEAAGVAGAVAGSDVRVLAIRGISDYCDKDKYEREMWQPYAALVAACYLRALLGMTHSN